ncbi:hypothetical protein [Halobacteriovorax sp. JY17]|uniref:hypothetical protein n=1 Tax=Halobacteriovorax sp. JY17 TaxID=2014617 RepID=UPI000C4EB143|nr:hypothetical protein [Halobacteriovorax sp. JY17]PIK16132.1 MAG: hypothetical protein CES88_05205 [Halobacteriovorax sp. JY17]
MKKTLLILTLTGLFSIGVLAEDIQVKSLNQGICWIKEEVGSVKMASFNQGISVELNDQSLGRIHELNLPTRFEGALEARAFCSSHGLSLVFNAVEKNKRYCIWLQVEQDGFKTQSVGFTDSEGTCDGYKPGTLVLTLSESGIDEGSFLKKLEDRSIAINFKSFEVISEGLVKIELNEEDWGSESEFSTKFQDLSSVKYAEKSFFYHSIGEWSDLETLGRE